MTSFRSKLSEFLRFPKRTNDVEFISPLKIEECQARLFGSLVEDKRSLVEKLLDSRRNKVEVGTNEIILERGSDEDFLVRRAIDNRNDFQFLLYCRLIPKQANTLVKGQIVMHPRVMAFMAIWLGFAHLMTTCLILGFIASPVRNTTAPIPLIILFPIFGWSLIIFGYLAERKHRPALIRFVQKRLLDPQFDATTEDLPEQLKPDNLLGTQQILKSVAVAVIVLIIWNIFWQRLTADFPEDQYLNLSPALTLFPLGLGYYLGFIAKRKNHDNSLLRIVAAAMLAGTLTAVITKLIGLDLPVFPIVIAQQDLVNTIGLFNRVVNYGLLAAVGGCLGWLVNIRAGDTLSP